MVDDKNTPHRLQRAALLAEIIAAVAVVVSLVFVGLQLQRGTEEAIASTHQDLLLILNDNDNWLQDPVFADALLRSEQGRSAVSDMEYLQIAYWVGQRLSLCESVFQRREDNLVDDDMWSAWANGCAAVGDNPTALEVWRERRTWFADNFAAWFDEARRRNNR